MNKQKAEGYRNSSILKVNEIFYSIQGEGPFSGHAAFFIRLAGCNLQCPQCDTVYDTRLELTVSQLLDRIHRLRNKLSVPTSLVVITGGEPFRQDIKELVAALHDNLYKIQIETNGTIYPHLFPWGMCTIVCSPKGRINGNLEPRINAFKYVASASFLDAKDGLPNKVLGYKTPPARPIPRLNYRAIYLQPLDEKEPVQNKINQEAVVESCLKHGHILCLQLHKIIGKE